MELAQSTLSASFIDKVARQLLLRLLGRLEHGQLLLRDGGERQSFGAVGSDLHAEVVVASGSSRVLLLSDDGALIHRLTSPKWHVPKVYVADCAEAVTPAQLERLLHGVMLRDDPQPVRGLHDCAGARGRLCRPLKGRASARQGGGRAGVFV